MTKLAEKSQDELKALAYCPACGEYWRQAQRIEIASAGLGDEMFQNTVATKIAKLTYERCAGCASLIATDARRDPMLLNTLYRNSPESYWSNLCPQAGLNHSIEQRLAKRGKTSGRLCDVGCGNGGLLKSFGPQWTKLGIEPGEAAVRQAQQRGLDIVHGSASQLGLSHVADVATLIDVAEHLPDPNLELSAIYQLLRPGGVLVVLTGMADAWTARWAGPQWYYLHCFGHVTIFSRVALRSALERVGFSNVCSERFEHPGSVGLVRWLRRVGGNAARRALGRPAAAMHHFRDHQLVIAEKQR